MADLSSTGITTTANDNAQRVQHGRHQMQRLREEQEEILLGVAED